MAGTKFQGMIFEISADDITYTSVGCITNYSLDGAGRTEIDVTCNNSTAKEYMFGLRDFGSLSLDLNYEPDGIGLGIAESSYASDDNYFFRITYANPLNATGTGTIKDFEGAVMNISDGGGIDDKVSGTIEVKVSGDITKTPATSGA